MGTTLRFYRTGNRQIDDLQRELSAGLAPLLASPLASGTALRSLSIGTSPTAVLTGLNRPLVNWVILRLVASAAAHVWEVTQASSLASSQITLQASHACLVDLWVS
jgi:hypothetical protein